MSPPALVQHKAVILLHGLEATADVCQLKQIIKETDEKMLSCQHRVNSVSIVQYERGL